MLHPNLYFHGGTFPHCNKDNEPAEIFTHIATESLSHNIISKIYCHNKDKIYQHNFLFCIFIKFKTFYQRFELGKFQNWCYHLLFLGTCPFSNPSSLKVSTFEWLTLPFTFTVKLWGKSHIYQIASVMNKLYLLVSLIKDCVNPRKLYLLISFPTMVPCHRKGGATCHRRPIRAQNEFQVTNHWS